MKKFILTSACLAIFSIAIAQEKQPLIGESAPDFELRGLDGNSYSLKQFQGKYIVLHFAATWCPFCNAEAPHLQQLNEKYSDRNVQVLIIDVKEDQKVVKRAFKRFGFTFPVLLDSDGSVSASYAPEGVLPSLPRDEVPLASNIIIDKNGVFRFYSLLDSKNFDAELIHLQQTLDELIANRP